MYVRAATARDAKRMWRPSCFLLKHGGGTLGIIKSPVCNYDKFNHGPSNLVYFSLLSEAPCTSYYDDPSVHWCCVAASARCREFDIHKGEIPHHKIERPGCTCIPKLSIQQHYYRIKRLAATRNASCWDTAAAVRTRDIRMSSRPRAEYVNRVGYANYTLKH